MENNVHGLFASCWRKKKSLWAHRYSITVVSIYKITEIENYIYIVNFLNCYEMISKVFSY